MRMALAFGKHDVDAFLADITHEQYGEWSDFFQIEPAGWPAQQIAASHVAFWSVQAHSRRRLKFKPFLCRTAADKPQPTPEADRVKLEMMAISSQIRADILAGKLTGTDG